MLSCQELTELVTDYLEGTLTLRRRLSLEMHLGMCSKCREYLAQIRTTVDTLGRLPDEPAPEDIAEQLLARFREEAAGGDGEEGAKAVTDG